MTDLFATRQSTSDAELITAVRDGDDAAFAELYRRHLESAKAAARSLTRSRADADDVVAEGFTRILQAIRNGGGPQLAFRPYLVTAVRNAFYDRMRKDRRIDAGGEVPEVLDLAVLRQSDSSDDRALAARAFAALPERWQLVLWHTEVEGRTPAEVGPLLGLAPNAAAALAYRAREGLRQAYLQAHLQQPIPAECAEIRPQLGAYVRDGLSMRDRRRVDAHLETCRRCEELVGDLQEANTNLRTALIPLLLGVPAAKYLAQLHGGTGVTAFARRQPKGVQGVAAAAAAVIVVGIGAISVNRLNQPNAQAPVAARAPAATLASTKPGASNSRVATVAASAGPNQSGSPVTNDPLGPFTIPGPVLGLVPDSTLPGETIATAEDAIAVFPILPTNATTRATTTTRARSSATTTRPRATTTTTTTTTTTAATPAPGELTIPGGRTGGRNTTTTTATTAPLVALGITASTSAVAGLTTYVSVSLTNRGNNPFVLGAVRSAAVSSSSVTLQLPAGVTFRGIAWPTDGSWTCTEIAGAMQVACVPPSVAANSATRIVLELQVAGDTLPGSLPLSAMVRSGDFSAASTGSASLNIVAQGVAVPNGGTPLFYGMIPGGGLVVGGNSSLTCAGGSGSSSSTEQSPTCAEAQRGTGGRLNNRQNDTLVPVNVLASEPSAPTNSSSATVDLTGKTILNAYLAWSGDSADSTARASVDLVSPSGVHNSWATAAPVTALQTHLTAGSNIYESVADVTDVVKAAGSGTYTVANIAIGSEGLPITSSSVGGWSLFVVYADYTSATSATVVVVDQYGLLDSTDQVQLPPVTVTVGGLGATSTPVSLAYFANEGDLGRLGDSIKVNGIELSDGNAFDSSLLGAVNPAGDINGFGIDVDQLAVPQASPALGGTIVATFQSMNDRVSVGMVGFVVA